MPYFSRLTEIVNCNLSALLEQVADRAGGIEEIISEIQEGIAGARRSVDTAQRNVGGIERQIAEQQSEVVLWIEKARTALSVDREDQAREALRRKKEVENLVAGLEQNLSSAMATRDYLMTTYRAIEARLAEAERKRTTVQAAADPVAYSADSRLDDSTHDVEDELFALRKELGKV